LHNSLGGYDDDNCEIRDSFSVKEGERQNGVMRWGASPTKQKGNCRAQQCTRSHTHTLRVQQ